LFEPKYETGSNSYFTLNKPLGQPSTISLHCSTREIKTFPLEFSSPKQFVTEISTNRVAYLGQWGTESKLVVFDLSPRCEAVVSNQRIWGRQALWTGKKIYVFNDADQRGLVVTQFDLINGQLTQLKDYVLRSGRINGLLAQVEGDHLAVYFDENAQSAPIPHLVRADLDLASGAVSSREYEGYYLDPNGAEGLDFGKKGALLPLIRTSDFSNLRSIYLLDSHGALQLVALDSLYGAWIGDRVLINRGKGAYSSELAVLSGTSYSEEKLLPLSPGLKKDVSVLGNQIRFTNYHSTDRTALIHSDLAGNYEIVSSSPTDFPNSELPHGHSIEIQGDRRSIPATLVFPGNVACKAGEPKLPVIVYLHGGNDFTRPSGDWVQNENDHLILAQHGFVVLESNYFGDQYLERKYQAWGSRRYQIEGLDPQMADVFAAGAYARTIPCADPKKIILFGHSYGAIIAANYLTEMKYRDNDPFAAVVLRGGFYTFEALIDSKMRVWLSPRVATVDTDAKKQLRPSGLKGTRLLAPNPPLEDVNKAISMLDTLNQDGGNYYGVVYQLPDAFYDRVVPERRIMGVHRIPIFIMHGADDIPDQARKFELLLRSVGASVSSWYPENSGHFFYGEVQAEMADKIESFASGL
jgi:pimeloyl-ACP methyl ester carboxylesterase